MLIVPTVILICIFCASFDAISDKYVQQLYPTAGKLFENKKELRTKYPADPLDISLIQFNSIDEEGIDRRTFFKSLFYLLDHNGFPLCPWRTISSKLRNYERWGPNHRSIYGITRLDPINPAILQILAIRSSNNYYHLPELASERAIRLLVVGIKLEELDSFKEALVNAPAVMKHSPTRASDSMHSWLENTLVWVADVNLSSTPGKNTEWIPLSESKIVPLHHEYIEKILECARWKYPTFSTISELLQETKSLSLGKLETLLKIQLSNPNHILTRQQVLLLSKLGFPKMTTVCIKDLLAHFKERKEYDHFLEQVLFSINEKFLDSICMEGLPLEELAKIVNLISCLDSGAIQVISELVAFSGDQREKLTKVQVFTLQQFDSMRFYSISEKTDIASCTRLFSKEERLFFSSDEAKKVLSHLRLFNTVQLIRNLGLLELETLIVLSGIIGPDSITEEPCPSEVLLGLSEIGFNVMSRQQNFADLFSVPVLERFVPSFIGREIVSKVMVRFHDLTAIPLEKIIVLLLPICKLDNFERSKFSAILDGEADVTLSSEQVALLKRYDPDRFYLCTTRTGTEDATRLFTNEELTILRCNTNLLNLLPRQYKEATTMNLV